MSVHGTVTDISQAVPMYNFKLTVHRDWQGTDMSESVHGTDTVTVLPNPVQVPVVTEDSRCRCPSRTAPGRAGPGRLPVGRSDRDGSRSDWPGIRGHPGRERDGPRQGLPGCHGGPTQ